MNKMFFVLVLNLSIFSTFLVGSDQNSQMLIGCIENNEDSIDLNSNKSLLAVSKCLSSYVVALEEKIVKLESTKPSQIPSLSTEDSGENNNVYFGSGSGNGDVGSNNTGVGFGVLNSNQSGSKNVAVGHASLNSNISGTYNSALGAETLYSNTSGLYNTAIGYGSIFSNDTGSNNSALGSRTLLYNKNGDGNTAIGYSSLKLNIEGNYNTALGYLACSASLGSGNVCLGSSAGSLYEGSDMLFIANASDMNLIKGNFKTGLLEIGRKGLNSGGLIVNGNLGIGITNKDGKSQLSFLASENQISDLSLIFPSSSGTEGQTLTTDGNGKLFWSSTSTGNSIDTNSVIKSLIIKETTLTLSDSDSNEVSVDLTDAIKNVVIAQNNSNTARIKEVESFSDTNKKSIALNITEIAALSQDLTNFQTNSALNHELMRSEYSVGIASSVAISQISLAEEGFSVGVGYGSFNSEKEGAFGLGYGGQLHNGNKFKLKASFNNEVSGAGFTISFK
jgi:hypothetical protein